jgi:hypothetical protein
VCERLVQCLHRVAGGVGRALPARRSARAPPSSRGVSARCELGAHEANSVTHGRGAAARRSSSPDGRRCQGALSLLRRPRRRSLGAGAFWCFVRCRAGKRRPAQDKPVHAGPELGQPRMILSVCSHGPRTISRARRAAAPRAPRSSQASPWPAPAPAPNRCPSHLTIITTHTTCLPTQGAARISPPACSSAVALHVALTPARR